MIALAYLSQALRIMEPLGVCRIDDRGASCWSIDGAPDSELTARVDRQARSMPGELAFIQGKKNRFLIAQQETVASLSAFSAAGQVAFYWLPSESGKALFAVRVGTQPEATTATIVAKALITKGKPAEIEFREGSKAHVEDVRLTLGKVVRGANRMPFGPNSAFGWRFAIDRTESVPPGSLSFVAIGRDGKPIRYVDSSGRPYDSVKGEEIWRQIAAGKWDWRTPPEAEVAQFWPDFEQPTIWFTTNIDPKAVRRLQVRRMVEQTQTIGPFKLDPN